MGAREGPCPYLPKLRALPHPPEPQTQMFSLLFPFFSHSPPSRPELPAKLHILGEDCRQAGPEGPGHSEQVPEVTLSPCGGTLSRWKSAGPGLPCTPLPRPQRPRPLTLQHAPVGRVRDRVDVGRHLVPLLALVHVDDLLRVDGQLLVGIDHHAEEARVRLPNREPKLTSRRGPGGALGHGLRGGRQGNAPRGLHFRSAPRTLSCSSLTVSSIRQMHSDSHFRDGETEAQCPSGSPLALLIGRDVGEEKQGAGLDFQATHVIFCNCKFLN